MKERILTPDEEMLRTVREIRERVAQAAEKSGRREEDIAVMAVTKTVSPERINSAIGCGLTLLGENRVQEYLDKRDQYELEGCSVHFIGSLQTNKVKYIIDKVDMIQSVNSLKLAKEIQKRASGCGRVMDILLEVNIGEEESKSGIMPADLQELAKAVCEMPNLRLSGLMAIPPFDATAEQSRYYFSLMNDLFLDMQAKKLDNSNVRVLSMGMSGDFETAIECGSNLVRLGTILFGKRK